MPKLAWIIAGVLTTVLVVALVGWSVYEKSQELAQANSELATARAEAEKTAGAISHLNDKLAESQSRIEQLQDEKNAADAAVQSHRSLEDEMRAALESKDVTISQLQGKLTVNILDRVLFDSGEAELKPDGEGILRKVAAFLGQHPTLKVHVIGHTDNVPIRTGARSRFATNWDLSAARAIAAVRFLSEKAGLDPRRLGAVGYGEFRPVADNATPEGRARNRRIAITILSEEMAGSDAMPASAPAAPSLLPAPGPAKTPASPASPPGPPEG
jgi:chemotaxis protein MotB